MDLRGRGTTFIVPALLLFAVFEAYPLFSSFYYSLFNWPGFGPAQFVGLGNFMNLVQDPEFLAAVRFTLMYTGFTTLLQTVVPMLLAILLMYRWRGGLAFRTMLFIPCTISLTITGLLWQLALQPDGGIVDRVLGDIGLGSLARPWLASSALVLPVLIIVSLWQALGFYLLIYFAGLQGTDPGLFESATVDGATGWQLTRYITVPSLRTITTLVVSLNLINGLKAFDLVYTMTNGGPGTSSQTLGVYLYQLAFGSEEGATPAFGYADAVGVTIMFGAAILFVAVQAVRKERA